jgi:hypothetical protein
MREISRVGTAVTQPSSEDATEQGAKKTIYTRRISEPSRRNQLHVEDTKRRKPRVAVKVSSLSNDGWWWKSTYPGF